MLRHYNELGLLVPKSTDDFTGYRYYAEEQLTTVHHAVVTWVRDNGYAFNDMMFCIYHVSPAETQNPDEYVTEVCYAVKKK